ncbi:hypothetical protein PPACK8108_LOCUS11248 [Phakopsora pachyrhizi]|uniref:HECT-type E3 ubiquitin transferase n=1 Tax=Phakopsora pachyrhizi TaxID=170000 RepID=A0AAV0B1W5_PHAPC|nr:hypothetical protein PPACK8108_LOCUS11248 [Phakopsora pachyrhizi]
MESFLVVCKQVGISSAKSHCGTQSPRPEDASLDVMTRFFLSFTKSHRKVFNTMSCFGDKQKYGRLSVQFYNEEGVDAGGVTREWLTILVKQMLDPNYALFTGSDTHLKTYQPTTASSLNPDNLGFFTFCGQVIGKATENFSDDAILSVCQRQESDNTGEEAECDLPFLS